ncbi:MAG: hypothetical protein D8H99_56515 [Streptococcus sp.]|nr:MAG: hypothetical protein D8H99_56515 [Streptococcus sp.]
MKEKREYITLTLTKFKGTYIKSSMNEFQNSLSNKKYHNIKSRLKKLFSKGYGVSYNCLTDENLMEIIKKKVMAG